MVETNGVEWKRFYSDKVFWPEGWFHDDEVITVDGKHAVTHSIDLTAVPDEARVTIEGGDVFKGEYDAKGPSLEEHFKAWRKKQDSVVMVIEVPKGKLQTISATVTAVGGKVLK